MASEEAIRETIHAYFQGIYYGDIAQLREAFDVNCQLRGEINGQTYFRTLEEYLEGVASRQSPSELGEPFSMRILKIELTGIMAYVKLHVPLLGFNYYDLMLLIQKDGKWQIVHKLFTHVPKTPKKTHVA